MKQLQNIIGHSEEASPIQTSKSLALIKNEKRHDFLEKVGIYPIIITPKNMVALQVDLGIPWEKLKCMTR